MEDNNLDEIRVCTQCSTKTFCDYCPKCGAKMPASKSMNRLPFWKRSDMDRYRDHQSSVHNRSNTSSTIRSRVATNQSSTHIYANDTRNRGDNKDEEDIQRSTRWIFQFIAILFILFMIFLFPLLAMLR